MNLLVLGLGNLGEKAILNFGVPFARDKLPGLVSNIASNAASNAINKFKIRISGKGAVRARKGFTLLISNEYMDHIIKIVNLLENSAVLTDGFTEAVKHEIKKQKGGFLGALLAPLAASVRQLVISSVVKGITGRGVMRAGKGYYIKMDKNL